MSSFDPMAVAIDWLDAYRATSPSIVDLYSDGASLECGCNARQVIVGRQAIAAYWKQRFMDKPAGELDDLQPDGSAVVVSYRAAGGIVRAILEFDAGGKIVRSRCGPARVAPLQPRG